MATTMKLHGANAIDCCICLQSDPVHTSPCATPSSLLSRLSRLRNPHAEQFFNEGGQHDIRAQLQFLHLRCSR